ncbi:hypothetical protein [Streptomyces flaveus]|uniref:hypothetical protein n=1 Tax=Streptomyces flaveus TaxID=66370 RepID=UPI0033292329
MRTLPSAPTEPWVPDRLHWPVPDPTRTGTDDAFADALSDLADRVYRSAPAVRPPWRQR